MAFKEAPPISPPSTCSLASSSSALPAFIEPPYCTTKASAAAWPYSFAGHDDTPKPRPQAARAIRVGDTVELVRFGTRASVLAINKDGSYLLQAGIMKVTAQPDEVYLIEETKQQAKKIIERSQRAFRSAGASTELDLRGMSADEAIATLDIFLDNAMMANLASVRIIHGKGTGVLRKAVQDELKRNRCVKRYRLGVYGEGEDGVTIAELA